MDRLKATNSVAFANRDIAPASGTPQYATDGNPATNTAPTIWPAYAFNMIMDELMAVITAAGITPDDTNWAQLLSAFQRMTPASQNATLSATTTLTAANAGTYYNVGGGTTQTLPAPSAVAGLTFGFFASGSFTLTTPSGQIVSAGLAASSVSLAAYDWIFVQSDGGNYRVIGCAPGLVGAPGHQFPVANASAAGNAVALGQFLAPQTTASTHGVLIGSGFSETLTLTGTAPSAGYVLAWASINPTAAAATGSTISTTLDIQGSTVSSDATVLAQSHFGVAAVASGASISVTYNVAATGTPGVNATFRVMYAFIPHT